MFVKLIDGTWVFVNHFQYAVEGEEATTYVVLDKERTLRVNMNFEEFTNEWVKT